MALTLIRLVVKSNGFITAKKTYCAKIHAKYFVMFARGKMRKVQ